MTILRPSLAATVALFALLLASSASRADTVVVEVLAATGQQVPGEPAGVQYAIDLGGAEHMATAVGPGGDILFLSDLAGAGIDPLTNGHALFMLAADGSLTCIARRGDPAPGLPAGSAFMEFLVGGVAADGSAGFRGELDVRDGGGGVTKLNDKVLYRWTRADGAVPVAREGDVAPGETSLRLWPFEGWFLPPALVPRVTATGRFLFSYPLVDGDGFISALFFPDDAGTLRAMVREGGPVPGMTGGERVAGAGLLPAMNDAGAVVFFARIKAGGQPGDAPVSTANDTILVGPGPGGVPTVLAREGFPVPGMTGAVFQEIPPIERYDIANDGRVAFSLDVKVGSTGRKGLFQTGATGAVELLATSGDPAPGFEDLGGTYKTFQIPARASDGTIVWISDVATADEEYRTVYRRDPAGGIERILYSMGPVPGQEGATFGWPAVTFHLNAAGQVMLLADVYTEEGGFFVSRSTLFLSTPGKGLQRLLGAGDPVVVAPGDVRTVRVLKLPDLAPAPRGDSDGRLRALTDDGRMVLPVWFIEDAPDPVHYLNQGLLRLHVVEGDANRVPVAGDDAYTAGRDTTLAIAAPGVLADDSDPDGDALAASVVVEPAFGALSLGAAGGFSYVPEPGFTGEDVFRYRACDAGGLCAEAAVVVTVLPADACTVFACDPATGCLPADRDCDDGDPCTDDACHAVAGCASTPRSCDDGDPCTDDTCGPDGACGHAAVGGCCSGDAFCRQPGVADADPCTDDVCDLATRRCVTLPIPGCCQADIECEDGSACTSDVCAAEACAHVPVVCDDHNACTTDACDPASGCSHAAVDCADDDPCTLDACLPGAGCIHDVVQDCCHDDADCDDAYACTTDRCTDHRCEWSLAPTCCYTPADCDDADACTQDFCDPGTAACLHVRIPGETACDGDDRVQLDTCGEVLEVIEACPLGCTPHACCGPGFHAQDGACVPDGLPGDVAEPEDAAGEVEDADSGGGEADAPGPDAPLPEDAPAQDPGAAADPGGDAGGSDAAARPDEAQAPEVATPDAGGSSVDPGSAGPAPGVGGGCTAARPGASGAAGLALFPILFAVFALRRRSCRPQRA